MRIVVAGLRPDDDALAELLGAEVDAHGPIILIHVIGDPASDAADRISRGRDDVEIVDVVPATEVIITTWRVMAQDPQVALLCRPHGWRHPLSAQISAVRELRVVDVPFALGR